MKRTLAVLGAGNMGLAITDGILKSGVLSAENIILVRRDTDKLIAYHEYGCRISNDLARAAKEADVLVLAMKPQMMPFLYDTIRESCNGKLVISIAAGVKIETIENNLKGAMVVRAMPNTPLTVGEGVTEICRSKNVSDEDFAFARSIFEGSGFVFNCNEDEINALTALTSSAVAYFAVVERAMCQWAKENGLGDYDEQLLCDLVSKTALGSAKLMYEKSISPDSLIKSVASPNGTTERALNVFAEKDIDGIFDEAMTACLKRAEELSNCK